MERNGVPTLSARYSTSFELLSLVYCPISSVRAALCNSISAHRYNQLTSLHSTLSSIRTSRTSMAILSISPKEIDLSRQHRTSHRHAHRNDRRIHPQKLPPSHDDALLLQDILP